MSQTPTVAEQAAAPPPGPGPSDGSRPERQPLAFMLTHQSGVVIVVALVIALAVGALLIRLQGVAPLFAYETLIKQALFVPGGLTRTLQKTAPLVLTGLAVVLPLRVGLFNIGGQGQLIFGAMFGAWVAYAAGGYGILGAALGMLAGIVAGAFVGWIAGVLKARRGVHEVITTIMLNYIAAGVTWWLVTGPLQAETSKTSGIPQTELIPPDAQVGAVAKIPIGFLIAVLLAVACWWMLSRSTLGFRFNTVGPTSTPPATPASTSAGSSPCRWCSVVAWPAWPVRSRPRARCSGSSRPSAAPWASSLPARPAKPPPSTIDRVTIPADVEMRAIRKVFFSYNGVEPEAQGAARQHPPAGDGGQRRR